MLSNGKKEALNDMANNNAMRHTMKNIPQEK